MSKKTIKIEIWTDDEEAAASFAAGVGLLAEAAFERHEMTGTGIGLRKLRAASGGLGWSAAS